MNNIVLNASVVIPSTEERAYAQTNSRLNKLNKKVDDTAGQINDNIDNRINAMTATLNTQIAAMNSYVSSQVASMNTSLENTEAELESNLTNRIRTTDTRIDNIIANYTNTDENSELIDIRTASDGRIYGSAGTAVREQVYDIRNLLGKVDKEVFTTVLQQLELTYTLGYQHVDGTLTESQLYSHSDISVIPGDVFYITGWNFYNVLLFAILDENGNVLRQEQDHGSGAADEYTDFKVIIPENASILRINKRETPQQSNFVPTVIKEIKTGKTASALSALSQRVSAQENAAEDNMNEVRNIIYSSTRELVDMDNLHTGMMIKTWVTSANMDEPSSYLGGNSSRIYTDVYPVRHGDIIKSAFYRKGQMNFTYMLFDSYGSFSSTGTGTSVTVANDGYIIFDFPNNLLLPEGIVIVENNDDFPYPLPYKRLNFKKDPAPDTELPLDIIDKTGGFTALFHDIGIIGDSLACGCMEGTDKTTGEYKYTDNLQYSWPACIERATGCACHMFGRGGQYLHGNNWYDEWKQSVLSTPCTAYIICIGFNDSAWLRQSQDNLGTLADIKQNYESNPDTFYGQYGKMISLIKSVQPDAKLFLVNMEWNSTDSSDLNDAISEICGNTENCYLIDLCTYAHEPYWDVPNIYKTGLYHKNTLGYQKTAWDIMSYIDYIVRHNPDDFIDVQFIGTNLRLPTQAEINSQS